MTRRSSCRDHHDDIVKAYSSGTPIRQIADKYGFTYNMVQSFIKRVNAPEPLLRPGQARTRMNMGGMGFRKNFSQAQIDAMEDRAQKIECETLCEWVVEEIREMLAKEGIF